MPELFVQLRSLLMKCIFEGCENRNGPESIEIKHKGELVGYVCDVCQRGPQGFKLTLKKNDEGVYVPIQAVPLSSMRE